MADTYTLHLQNFRSIRDAKIDLAPLTVIYGPNGSGKSSLIYGLLTLKNFLTNPNQHVASLFSYPSISLGGLQEVVHNHADDQILSASIAVSSPEIISPTFALGVRPSEAVPVAAFDASGDPYIRKWPRSLSLRVPLPYRGNQTVDHEIETMSVMPGVVPASGDPYSPVSGSLNWNGTVLSAQIFDGAGTHDDVVSRLNQRSNFPMELARWTGFVPLRRGFSKPSYGLASVTPMLWSEDEVASLLASPDNRFRSYHASGYLEQVADRRVQVQPQIGTSAFTIDTIPLDGGTPVSIVNEGFGINQLLYMLTICLYSPFKIVAIEEPEIHLHPSLVRKLAHALIDISANEDRRLIISTHSETFVVALLTQIAAGKVGVDDVSFVLAENRDGESVFTQQSATKDGQLEGGLAAFMEAEIADLAIFLGVSS